MLLSVPPTSLGELRQHVLLPLIGNSLFSEAEQLRANHFVHESENIARLIRWGASVLAEIARREAEAAHQRRGHATRASLYLLRATPFRAHCPHLPRPSPSWVVGASLPDRAGPFDRWAARFQVADARTYVSLLSRQAR